MLAPLVQNLDKICMQIHVFGFSHQFNVTRNNVSPQHPPPIFLFQKTKWFDLIQILHYHILISGIAIQMLKYFNQVGIFKNDDVWFPAYFTYNVAWNFSDASDLFAKVCVNFFFSF